ncbi:TetR/AcrR family transcriptional regulator [Nocardiopsis sediminis]|uniref:TetR/AcrR family transcriptional regulator n=1 Tax=Nocardiopsis sediminis TaxID=1778267 RepID=A0ABV8FJQ1_9ACTN
MSGRGSAPAAQVAQDRASTRERLVESAVRMFGERGIEATSMRALTEAAGTNIAAVNYHFGSKEGLLRAAVDQTMRAVNDERGRRLDELEAASPRPAVPDLVRAFVEPGAGLALTHGARGPDVARFIGRIIGEPDPRVRRIFAEQVGPVEGRYLAALGRALPDLGDDGVRFAYTSMLGLLATYQSGAFAPPDRPLNEGGREAAAESETEWLVAFVTGGILAILVDTGRWLA